jgi:Aspartyl/Asparaginyl beta-hydroxylase
MLDLPGQPVLDKLALVGGCLRLPLRIDAERLRREIAQLPEALWGTTGGRVGVHREVQALFLRGYAPAQGEKPIEDREPLALLPYARHIIEELIPASPLRCLLAQMPAGVTIAPHIDRAPYFSKSLRLHFPVESHDRAWMVSGTQTYLMSPGEVWVLNNSAPHAVWNAHETQSRTHMICDFLPSEALLKLCAAGDRNLGRSIEAVDRHFAQQLQAATPAAAR